MPEGSEALSLALAGLVLAAAVAFLLTPVAARVAGRFGAIDLPGARRVHVEATPRGGGLAIAVAFLVVGGGLLVFERAEDVVPLALRPPPREVAGLFLGAVVAAALGFVDDRLDLRARWQFLAQAMLAAIGIVSGMTIAFIANPFGGDIIRFTGIYAVGFTAFWIVGMINAINWIDGLDGLSTGIATIAALTLGGISMTVSPAQPIVAVLCLTFAGALLGFLPWNFHPARIFVGTSGVFLIGYLLAVLSLLGTAKVAVALLVLGVPIIDAFWIIVRRVANGSSPFTPDRGHLHHRLLDLGLGHREAVVLIYGICTLLAVLSFRLSGTGQVYAFLGIVIAGGVILWLLTTQAGDRSATGLDASAYDGDDPPAGAPGGETTESAGDDSAPQGVSRMPRNTSSAATVGAPAPAAAQSAAAPDASLAATSAGAGPPQATPAGPSQATPAVRASSNAPDSPSPQPSRGTRGSAAGDRLSASSGSPRPSSLPGPRPQPLPALPPSPPAVGPDQIPGPGGA